MTTYQKQTIFIFGSISLNRLYTSIANRLKDIAKETSVIIGDAPGIDKVVQEYLYERKYDNVTVYHMGEHPRNNIGNWKTISVKPIPSVKWYVSKDIFMTDHCTEGIAFWDGKSSGSKNNIYRLNSQSKRTEVHFVNSEETIMAYQPRAAAQYNPLRQTGLQIRGKPWNPDNGKDSPSVTWRMMKKGPVLQIRYNDNVNKDMLSIPLMGNIFLIQSIFTLIQDVAGRNEPEEHIQVIKSRFFKNQDLGKVAKVCKITIGRDSELVVFFTIDVKGYPLVKVPFTAQNWYDELITTAGEPVSAAFGSTIRAKAYAETMKALISTYIITMPDPDPEKTAGGSSGGTGGAQSKIVDWDADDDVHY